MEDIFDILPGHWATQITAVPSEQGASICQSYKIGCQKLRQGFSSYFTALLHVFMQHICLKTYKTIILKNLITKSFQKM